MYNQRKNRVETIKQPAGNWLRIIETKLKVSECRKWHKLCNTKCDDTHAKMAKKVLVQRG